MFAVLLELGTERIVPIDVFIMAAGTTMSYRSEADILVFKASAWMR
jgi:hypothetical protein